MKAAVLRERGGTFEVVDLYVTPPGPGEVRIALDASGVCHSDLSFALGRLGESQPPTCVLGHEGAGVVTECGPGVVRPREGDHVVFSTARRRGWTLAHATAESDDPVRLQLGDLVR
jgi:S-(hydroxymethyl)glutathione dehydrogenase / alcohol dehydrogenase